MEYSLSDATQILGATPATMRALIAGLPAGWERENEGPGTWSPHDIVAHFLHGERTDWMPRVRHLLEHGTERLWTAFDIDGFTPIAERHSTPELLELFATERTANLTDLVDLKLSDSDLERRAVHPGLGEVTLRNHLSAWVAHDMCHAAQAARAIARNYEHQIGPWRGTYRWFGATDGAF